MRFIGGWFGSATADAVNSATPQMMRAKPRALRADMCFSPTLSLRTHNRDLLTAINSRSVLQAGASKRDLAVHFPLTFHDRYRKTSQLENCQRSNSESSEPHSRIATLPN